MDTLTRPNRGLFQRSVLFLFQALIRPRATSEEEGRREFILNILLVGSAVLVSILLCVVLYDDLTVRSERHGIEPLVMEVIAALFFSLLWLSRRGWVKTAAIGLIAMYFLPTVNALRAWGADLPMGLLTIALLIVMSSILMGNRFAFFLTALSSACVAFLTYAHEVGLITASVSWKASKAGSVDAISESVIFLLIAVISWLFNREIRKSLQRAQASEAALREERDLLEVKVEERTQELKRLQLEKMNQYYRFVEFGRFASGFFHDIASPISAVRMNLEQAQREQTAEANQTRTSIQRASHAAMTLENFLKSVRKQIQRQVVNISFSLTEEVRDVIRILAYKGHEAGVELVFVSSEDVRTMGNPLFFHKIITNLVSNAIDAYQDTAKTSAPREVRVSVERHEGFIRCVVQDFATGITPEHLAQIFEPFFSTKNVEKGMGLGLSITKDMVEKEFLGTIRVESEVGVGSTFIVEFPIREVSS